jgi:hypothetical protein
MTKIIHITEHEFDTTYPLLPNHLNPNASFVTGDGPGCLFETYGAELDFVRAQDPKTVWTIVESDDCDLHLTSGYHYVNRIGYLISTISVASDVTIECCILLDTESEGDKQ